MIGQSGHFCQSSKHFCVFSVFLWLLHLFMFLKERMKQYKYALKDCDVVNILYSVMKSRAKANRKCLGDLTGRLAFLDLLIQTVQEN